MTIASRHSEGCDEMEGGSLIHLLIFAFLEWHTFTSYSVDA